MSDRPAKSASDIFPGLAQAVLNRFDTPQAAWRQPIVTVDSHTAGEPTRLVVGGLPPIPGKTINDKRLYLANEMDYVRSLLTREPRGHRDMFGAVITEPVSPDAAFGLIYMDARRYPYLCGHATIAAAQILIETGVIEAQEPETVVVIDTPSDIITTRARVEGGRVQSVAFQAEAAFVYQLDQPLDVPGLGAIAVDVVYVGGFFVMVSADEIGLTMTNTAELARLGMLITDAGNEQLTAQHPTRPYVNTIDVVEFYGPSGRADAHGKSAVILGEAHVDRSPCGTGTSAKMALLHRRGELAVGDTYVNEGILGTTFEARIVAEERVGDLPAIVPEVRGSAHITGVHQFLLDMDDPFPNGFLLSQPTNEFAV
ncbi:MAG: Proline racemase [Anaerolineales bacterium]|nr:Proline racemase [Anaerolineales bacterium]